MLRDRWRNPDPYYQSMAHGLLESGAGFDALWDKTWESQPTSGTLHAWQIQHEEGDQLLPFETERLAEAQRRTAAQTHEGERRQAESLGLDQPPAEIPTILPPKERPALSALMQPEEATAKYGIPGSLKFDSPVREGVAKLRYEWMTDQLRRQDLLDRSAAGVFPSIARGGAWVLAQAVDPLNVAASFIPVVGEARYASWLAKFGGPESFAARTAARGLKGAAEGFVGQAVLEPLTYAQRTEAGEDYTALDTLLDLTFGTVLGGGLHVGMGTMADGFSRLRFGQREALVRGAVGQMADSGEVRMDAATPPEMRAAADMVVAFKRGDEVVMGRRGETHADLAERLKLGEPETTPSGPMYLAKGYDDGFATSDGNFFGRSEAAKAGLPETGEDLAAATTAADGTTVIETPTSRTEVTTGPDAARAAEEARARVEAGGPAAGGTTPTAGALAAMADRSAAKSVLKQRSLGLTDDQILANADASGGSIPARIRAVMALSEGDLQAAAAAQRGKPPVVPAAIAARAAAAAPPPDPIAATREALAPKAAADAALSRAAETAVSDPRVSDTLDPKRAEADLADTMADLERARAAGAVSEEEMAAAMEDTADLDLLAQEQAAAFQTAAACIGRAG